MTTAPVKELFGGAASLSPSSLAEVNDAAELQTRVDAKYLVPPEAFAALVDRLPSSITALEIDGQRCFRYETVYFDTDDLVAYRAAASSRRRRFKVRTRSYLDTERCVLEVKQRGGRNETVKHAIEHDIVLRHCLTPDGLAFVAAHVSLPEQDRQLRPTLSTTYLRCTFLDVGAGARVTCDAGLAFTAPDGSQVELSDHILLETKSTGRATAADRMLWAMGLRPVAISKYCVGLALHRPELPANKWHRTLRRYFGRGPEPAGADSRRVRRAEPEFSCERWGIPAVPRRAV